jgi:hypothetical protein
MKTPEGIRDAMFTRLDKSLRFLTTASLQDCAAELVVQGLALVSPRERAAVIEAGLAELAATDRDEQQIGPDDVGILRLPPI